MENIPIHDIRPRILQQAKETARTNARPAALRFGVKGIPGHLRKAWELRQSQALWSPQPSDGPAEIAARSSLVKSLSPSGSFSVLSCPWPSSDLFALFTSFISRPQKTAKALHCVDHNKLISFQLQPHAPHLLNRCPEAQTVGRRRIKPGAISFFLGPLGSSSRLLLGADICGGEDAQETSCPRNLPASRRERTGWVDSISQVVRGSEVEMPFCETQAAPSSSLSMLAFCASEGLTSPPNWLWEAMG